MRKLLFFIYLLPTVILAQGNTDKYPLPKQKYEVRIEKSRMVPMRDGVRLATDLYFPLGAGEKHPVILIRTPYNKNAGYINMNGQFFAGQGYVVVAQDCRGKFESEGDYVVSMDDTPDGFDAVNWAASQPWSTGKVGTYGCSYLGENQVQMAKVQNPNLIAMIPQAAGTAHRYFGLINGGAFELVAGFGWFRDYGSKVRPVPELPEIDYQKIWMSLPLTDMQNKAGSPPTDWVGFVSHEPADPWWDKFGYVKDTHNFDVPALHIGSWYDIGVAETLKLFDLFQRKGLSERSRNNQFVIISPTVHCASEWAMENTKVGNREVGDARFDYYGTYLRWFDYWLKSEDNGVLDLPKVQYYVMGKNEWRSAQQWPLAETQYIKYYFHSDGNANTRLGSGVLNTQPPKAEPPDQYIYDPANPVPTVGGPICCSGTPDAPAGAFDQSEVEMNDGVLVYTTPVLEKGIEVTGPLRVVLYASSNVRDTDFTAKLVDVYPDGIAYNVQEAILRARYREGYNKKLWLQPGEVTRLIINLHATSNYFPAGHRIRLEISSSNFPRFDRNLNTGGNNYDETEWIVATNTIYHSDKYPSHLLLPVIPEVQD